MKVLFTPPKNLFNVSKLLFLALFALTPLISKAYAWDGSSIAKEYDGGRGTSESPYQIADGSQLAFLAQQVNAGHLYTDTCFILTADIDLSSKPWTPIGDLYNNFCGIFDGQNFKIKNLYIIRQIHTKGCLAS